jgi:hypothetical protein
MDTTDAWVYGMEDEKSVTMNPGHKWRPYSNGHDKCERCELRRGKWPRYETDEMVWCYYSVWPLRMVGFEEPNCTELRMRKALK